MQGINLNNISVDPVVLQVFAENNIEADMLRLDKIHPLVSGNKWFKLRYYLEDAKRLNYQCIATFGGAWSNHILATAAACKLHGLQSVGLIRGEEIQHLTPTLLKAKELGMRFYFITRDNYRGKNLPAKIHEDLYVIQQGGYGRKGADGAATIFDYCSAANYTHICCALGTGTMAAGLANATVTSQVLAINVLKTNFRIKEDIKALLNKDRIEPVLINDYHFGGYAKHHPALFAFMNKLYQQTLIPSDFVYTGKLFYAIADLAAKKYFPPGSRLLLIHSGGLQGNDSLSNGTLIF